MHNVIPRLSDTPGRLRMPAPRLGEHTEEILGQLGVDRATLERLAAEGVIGLGREA
jgi:crotonobetainyl-CoA:carnitine CoA-transferase CaiB-like acyl-CoA transferase